MSAAIVCLVATSAHAQVTEKWTARYNGPENGVDEATAVAVDPLGIVCVTGRSHGGASGWDYATVAYDAATGTELWVARYNGPGNDTDIPTALALDGTGTAYVTGYSKGAGSDYDYATVAYDVATGAQLWVARYNGPSNGSDAAYALAVDGIGKVYVTGSSNGPSRLDYATLAYDAATGMQLWTSRYSGPGGFDAAAALAVDGVGNVYVTGYSDVGPGPSPFDYATVAYDAATGTQLWVARYNGPQNGSDLATALAVDTVGNVYVTGFSDGGSSRFDYATVAYDAATGTELWAARYGGLGTGGNFANALAVDSVGNVYVTGSSAGDASGFDYATVAYEAMTGTQRWVARYNGPGNGNDGANALRVDDVGHIYVAGSSFGGATGNDYATVAYEAMTGTQVWVARYDGPGNGSDGAGALVVDVVGNVYVTGTSWGGASGFDYATIMYSQP